MISPQGPRALLQGQVLALALGISLATSTGAQNVVAPPGWVSGDVHEMIQLCMVGGSQPPDRPLSDVYAEMQAKNLNVMDVLVLITGNATCATYLAQYAPLVTGAEDPLTASDPDHVIQFGVEIVGGDDPNCLYQGWGHPTSIGANNGAYLLGANYPGPNLDFYSEQPGALTGYAHVSWPEGTQVPDDFPPINRGLTRLHPLLAPVDLAMGRVDFISTADVSHNAVTVSPYPWWGLYYKLLNAGLPVSLAAGTVAQCYEEQATLDPRTWALTSSAPLTHEKWIDAIEAGRTSVSEGGEDFLRMRVDGQGAGSRLYVDSPAQVSILAELTTSVPRSTTLEIVQNGVVVASDVVQLTTAGSHLFTVDLPVPESGWFAARTQLAHTAATYVFVDNRAIADEDAAEYFRALSTHIDDFLDAAVALCNNCTQQPCFACEELHRWVGTSEAEIRADLAQGAKVYKALRNYARPTPQKVERYGTSTPSCRGPLGIGVLNPPVVGRPATLTCFNAPPNSTGALVLGYAPSSGTPYAGATLYVAQAPPPQVYMVTSDAGGFASLTLKVPKSTVPLDVYCQFMMNETADCSNGPTPATVASDALKVHIPRSLFFER